MALIDDLPLVMADVQAQRGRVEHNEALFNIFEGELLPYILRSLQAQLSPRSFEQVKFRIAPINVLKRITDKLSRIYSRPPLRTPEGGGAIDAEMFSEYLEYMQPNTYFGLGNEFFNLFKNTFVMPYVDRGIPKIRIVPSNLFFVYSNDKVNPLRVTHYVQSMGTLKSVESVKGKDVYKETPTYHVWTDTEFAIVDGDGKILPAEMARYESDGVNPYGKIPGVYINRSRHCLTPKPDTDTLSMTTLIPVLLSDLNLAVMFQAFSIVYGINVTSENLKMAPNAFWELSTPVGSNVEPKVGTIKPEVDSDKVLALIKAQLQFWLQSKNIKPGAMGEISADNLSSGVAKVIDEMDTSEDRAKQVPFFQDAEQEFWDLIVENMHPVWVATGEIDFTKEFTNGFSVQVVFPEQKPAIDSTKLIGDEVTKLEKGLTTRRAAIHALNPDSTPDQVEEIMKEIETERTVSIGAGNPDNPPSDGSAPGDGAGNSVESRDLPNEGGPNA